MSQDIRLIAAIGVNGEVGLNGELPWPSSKSDFRLFKKLTTDSVVIVGRNTWPTVEHLDGTHGRLFLIDGAPFGACGSVEFNIKTVSNVADVHAKRIGLESVPIWVAGGPKTWSKWATHYTSIHLSFIDYSGEADTYFPWEVISGRIK